MKPHEFADYVAYFVPDYAAEISSNYDVDIETARARASREVEESLGQGVETAGQVLLSLVAEDVQGDTPVGYLWCKPDEASRTVFISDFCVLPPFRGRGYGKAALAALETMFAETEYDEIRLRVAADNKGAERLYLSVGYRPTGINMRKAIASPKG